MRATGFSFSCPCPARSKDEEFERFIQTTKNEPNKINNPWPLLAGWKTFRQARTHPLSRIVYVPTTEDPYKYASSLDEVLTYLHECYHMISRSAPAKLLARLLLGRAYDSLSVLLHGDTWDCEMEKSWAEINKIDTQLSNISRSIMLSEELLATAFSFGSCTLLKRFQSKVLREKEEAIVANCSKLTPFNELYYQTFKKAMQWYMEGEYPIFQYLEIYLQGIKRSKSPRAIRIFNNGGGAIVADSAKRCRVLVENVNRMTNGKELYEWLNRIIDECGELVYYFGLQDKLSVEKDLSVQRYSLWKLMVGETELPDFDRNTIEAALYCQKAGSNWYITYAYIDDYHSRDEVDALVRILGLESLLEQLTSGNGICCPYYDPLVGCHCDPDWSVSLNRILLWAREGKFDQGRFNRGCWKDLPQECRINP